MPVQTLELPKKVKEEVEDFELVTDSLKGLMVIPRKEGMGGLEANLRAREKLLKAAEGNRELRRDLYSLCNKRPLFFFNFFLWTYDPRKAMADLPFITWDYQDDFVQWVNDKIEKGEDGLAEKSRDLGVSWCVVGVFLYRWLFKAGFQGHIGSKSEDDVDRSGDIKSLFEKFRYFLKYLPDWMLPARFDFKKHSMFMRIVNPSNGNAITGESANRNFARQGRYTAILLDEFAVQEHADEIWTATGDSSPCRLVVSTPCGTGNKFWFLRFKSEIDRKTLHWSAHPEKSKGLYEKDGQKRSIWYDAECSRRSLQEVAQELDIDYLASGHPYFDLKKVDEQKEFKPGIGILTDIDGKMEFRPTENGWLRLFEKPDKAGQYVIGLDPAEGLSHGDRATASVRDKKTRNLMAGIYGIYDYDQLAIFSYLTGKWYNSAFMAAEAGGYGAAVNKRLYDLGANVARAVDLSKGVITERDKLGFITNSTSRPQMLADMEAEIREKACELRDPFLKSECMNFINNDGKPMAAKGSTDDYIFSFAIAGQLLRISPYTDSLHSKKKRLPEFNVEKMQNGGFGF